MLILIFVLELINKLINQNNILIYKTILTFIYKNLKKKFVFLKQKIKEIDLVYLMLLKIISISQKYKY